MNPHRRPGLPGTIARTAAGVAATAAALSAWLWLLFTGHFWLATTEGLTAGIPTLLYVMMRAGGMGRCLACWRVIPALWGGAYCAADMEWLGRLDTAAGDVIAWSRLVGMHGPDRVAQLVTSYGVDTVNRIAHDGAGAIPPGPAEQEQQERRAFLGYPPQPTQGTTYGTPGGQR